MAEKDHYRWYVTLNVVKNELGLSGTGHDAMLQRFIARATAIFERATDRIFIPETRTRYFDFQRAARLVLGYDLLSVTTLSDDEGEVDSGDYFLYSGYDDLNTPPYNAIELLGTDDLLYYTDTKQKAITIVGEWGYCNDYENTGLTLAAAITSITATTLTAATKTLEVGWSLLIGDEQMFVSAITTGETNDTATVRRGQGGTEAATHLLAAKIYRYVVPYDVEDAVSEIARLRYELREAMGVSSEKLVDYAVTFQGEQVTKNALATIRRYQRLVY